MREANFTVSAMHGDMPQKERTEIMKEFRGGARCVIFRIGSYQRIKLVLSKAVVLKLSIQPL